MGTSNTSHLTVSLKTTQTHLLVQQLETRLAHSHFLLNAKLRNGGVLGRTLSTENLPAGSTVVLGKATSTNPGQTRHGWYRHCCDRLLENHKNLQVPQFQRSLAYLSSHNSKLDSTPVALLSVHPVRSLDKAGKHILSSYCIVKPLLQDSLVVSLSKQKGEKKK